MGRWILVVTVLLMCVCVAFAAEPKTKSGDKALMFTINGLGNFGVGSAPVVGELYSLDHNGSPDRHGLYGFGGKWYISDNTAFRGAVNFSWEKTETKSPQGTSENSETFIGFAPGLEWHFGTAGPVTGYFGGMAEFGWRKDNLKPAVTNPVESNGSGTLFGVAAIMGAEYFPWDMVSLGAEYNLGFTTNSTKVEAGGTSTDGPTVTNIGIGSWAVTLSVYLGD